MEPMNGGGGGDRNDECPVPIEDCPDCSLILDEADNASELFNIDFTVFVLDWCEQNNRAGGDPYTCKTLDEVQSVIGTKNVACTSPSGCSGGNVCAVFTGGTLCTDEYNPSTWVICDLPPVNP